MSDRKPVRDTYDAVIDLGVGDRGSYAGAIVKLAYRMGSDYRPCDRAPAVPLENDLRDPDLQPRVPPHSDFWPHKRYTDVAVVGSAYAPEGRPVEEMRIGIEIGDRGKHVDVIGNRAVEWSGRRPRIGAPEPFEEMPLTPAQAYGGVDFRVPFDDEDERAMGVTLNADHPGLYPRNPWGKGYIASEEPLEGFGLPNLENPSDRLTDDRLIADPELWFRQPLPWHLGWTPVNCFPRNLFLALDCDPWFPPPDDDTLDEVRHGLLPHGYRTVLEGQGLGAPPRWQFHQEASHGLVMSDPPYGAPLRLAGMHPDRARIECRVPDRPPVVQIIVEGRAEPVQPSLASIAIYPDRDLLTMTWTARRDTPRPFIPGIHAHIPIAVSVDGDSPIEYVPPTTVQQRLEEAQEASKP